MASILRVFSDGDDSRPSRADRRGLSPQMSLLEFYRAYVLPVALASAADRNRQQYAESLDYWAAFTGDPPLDEIDEYTATDFLNGLQALPGRRSKLVSKETVRKHCTHVQFCLDLAGPRSRALRSAKSRRMAKGLVAEAVWLERPAKKRVTVDRLYTLDEIRAVVAATRQATLPQRPAPGISSAAYWRALLTFTFLSGLRLGTLRALQWSWFREHEGEMRLHCPGDAMKSKQEETFFVDPRAWGAISAIRTPGPRVFAYRGTDAYLQRCLRKILTLAGLPKERNFGFHGFRRSFVTELSKINSVAAPMAAGHAGKMADVTREHYTNWCVMVEAMRRLPSVD